MGALDQVKSYFTGDVKIDDPEIRQALKNAFPNLARAGSEFDDLEYLPSAYVQEKIVPALMTMDEAHLQAFKAATQKTSGELHSLTTDIEQTLRYKPKDGNALPVDQRVPDKIKSAGKTIFKSAQDFISDTMNLRTDVEKEQALLAEVIASANRATIKFDQYVMRGGGTQYGDKANEWTEIDSLHRNISRPATDKEISHDVENVAKADFVNMTNSVVAMAQDTSPYVTLDGKAQLVGNGTRLDKLAYLASWMSALEEGCDSVLPGIVAQTANKAVKIGIDSTVGVAADFVGGIWDDYPKMTVTIAALAGYATYKTGGLVKGVLSVGGVPFKLAAKAASVFPMTKGAAPVLNRIGETLSFADKADAAGATGSGPETPRRFTAVNPGDLKEFGPGQANHLEYYNKTLEAIKAAGTAPAPGAAPGATPLSSAEVTKRQSNFMRLDAEYRAGGMSLAEYLKRTEDIIAGRGRLLVVDHTGAVDKDASIRNVAQRVADRTPLVSQVSRNTPTGSATASVNAIQAAKQRIKGTSYESVDFAGNKVELADTQAKMLFEEFRDKLERYSQMQEWDATNREMVAKEQLKNTIQGTDIPAKQAEITAKSGVLATTPQTIPGTPMVIPGQPPIPTQVPNPLIATLNEDLRQLQADLKGLNDQVRTLNGEIASLKGRPHAYVPAGGTRAQFQADVRALKAELSSPGATTGLIQRINAHLGSTAIPETALNPRDLKIDKIRLLEVVKAALKK